MDYPTHAVLDRILEERFPGEPQKQNAMRFGYGIIDKPYIRASLRQASYEGARLRSLVHADWTEHSHWLNGRFDTGGLEELDENWATPRVEPLVEMEKALDEYYAWGVEQGHRPPPADMDPAERAALAERHEARWTAQAVQVASSVTAEDVERDMLVREEYASLGLTGSSERQWPAFVYDSEEQQS